MSPCPTCLGKRVVTIGVDYGNRAQRRAMRKAGAPMTKVVPCPACQATWADVGSSTLAEVAG